VYMRKLVWANFLHIYQPAEQQPDILEAVVAQSYRPILRGIKKHKKVRLTLNINGALLELLDKYQYKDLIDMLRELVKEGRIELTSSAKYHALLPFLEEKEIIRQIEANNETLHFYFNHGFRPIGFFPPEMAYDERLPKIVESLGFKWMILDEIAKSGRTQTVDYHKLHKIEGTNLLVFFRERRPSNLIMSAVVRSYDSLKEAMREDFASDRYLITGMDGETFGHHRPGLEKMLFEIFASKGFDLVTISDLVKHCHETVSVVPVPSTWASSPDDIEKGIQFLSWSDPENILHQWQWELTNSVLEEVHALDSHSLAFPEVRHMMDICLASDHFWWASAKPWWSLEMIEVGVYRLLETIRLIPNISEEKLRMAADYYERIISTAFQWQRSGKIRRMMRERNAAYKIPFKDRTWRLGGEGGATYLAFLDMMRMLEKEAAAKGEYEKAILWRDAVWRLEHKTDIYEAINAIDLLRKEMPNEEIEKIIEKYRSDYRRIRGGQPEQRGA